MDVARFQLPAEGEVVFLLRIIAHCQASREVDSVVEEEAEETSQQVHQIKYSVSPSQTTVNVRNGFLSACQRGRYALRVNKSENPILQRSHLSRK